MQDPNTANQGDLIFKLDQDRAWLLENLDKGKWPEMRSELAALERKISKFIISVQENNGLRLRFELNAVPLEKWIEKQERLNRFFVKGLESEFIIDDNKKEFDFILFY